MKNIALIGFSLNHGGAEKNMANISILLCKKYHVHTIIVNDGIIYDYGGKLLNLGLLPNKTSLDRIKKFWTLKQYIKREKIEFLIDFRSRINDWEEIIIANFLYSRCKVVYTIHSFKIEHYIPKNKFLFKLWTLRNPKIIGVSQGIVNIIQENYNYKNIKYVPNPLDISKLVELSNENIETNDRFILFVGRLSTEKQIQELIKSYNNSNCRNNNIKFFIIGEGKEKDKIENLIFKLKLEKDVILLGQKNNPYVYMKQALFLVLASEFEGYPTVLIESFACKTPVISFDCASGPSEIIVDKTNGLLVKNQDFNAFTDAINLMMEDKILYLNCKENTSLNLDKHYFQDGLKNWEDIFHNL